MTDNQAISFVDRCLEKYQTQKDAEIDRLEKEIFELKVKCIRAEAIKEFLDKAEKKIEAVFGEHYFYDGEVLFLLDQIAKEMGVEL